jgi:hypothetical protein
MADARARRISIGSDPRARRARMAGASPSQLLLVTPTYGHTRAHAVVHAGPPFSTSDPSPTDRPSSGPSHGSSRGIERLWSVAGPIQKGGSRRKRSHVAGTGNGASRSSEMARKERTPRIDAVLIQRIHHRRGRSIGVPPRQRTEELPAVETLEDRDRLLDRAARHLELLVHRAPQVRHRVERRLVD